MDLRATDGVALRFHGYIEHLSEAVGHADRHAPLAEYCTGLLLPGEKKKRHAGGMHTHGGRWRLAWRPARLAQSISHCITLLQKRRGMRRSCSRRCVRSCHR